MGLTLDQVNVGSVPNDGAGDPLRDAFTKLNDNMTEIEAYAPVFYSFNTGALSAGVTKSIAHNRGLTNYLIIARDANDNNNGMFNLLKPTPSDPTNSIDIQSAIAIPGGVKVFICGI